MYTGTEAALRRAAAGAAGATPPLPPPPRPRPPLPPAPRPTTPTTPAPARPAAVWPRWQAARRYLLAELVVLHAVQRLRGRLPAPLRTQCNRLTSAHPAHDASLLVWLGAAASIWFMGWPMTWLLIANITASLLLAAVVPAAAPDAYDATLRPRGRASPTAFPCVELHLAVVLVAALAASPASVPAAVWVAAVAFTLALGCLRLLALTHFVYQLVGSAALGAASVPLLYALADRMFDAPPKQVTQALGTVLILLLYAGVVAYRIEAGTMFRMPAAEYARVATMVDTARAGRLHTLFRQEYDAPPPPPPLSLPRDREGEREGERESSGGGDGGSERRRSRRADGDGSSVASGWTQASAASSGSGEWLPLRPAVAVALPPERTASTLRVPPPAIPAPPPRARTTQFNAP